jgi:hypothetical protein
MLGTPTASRTLARIQERKNKVIEIFVKEKARSEDRALLPPMGGEELLGDGIGDGLRGLGAQIGEIAELTRCGELVLADLGVRQDVPLNNLCDNG